jgi:hypothetical protein
VGQVLSREKTLIQGADVIKLNGRQHGLSRYRERHSDPAWSETLRTHARFSYGNREIPRLALADGAMVRAVNLTSSTAMHCRGKSDSSVVPKKPSNKDRGAPRSAEKVEERELAKGNALLQNRS